MTIRIRKVSCSLALTVAFGLRLHAADVEDATDAADIQSALGGVSGVTRGPGGTPLTRVKVLGHAVAEHRDRMILSGGDGTFYAPDLKPGQSQLTANKDGFISSQVKTVEVAPRQSST